VIVSLDGNRAATRPRYGAAGNTTTATFTVTVRDDLLPVITAPDVVAEATGPNGAAVNFTGVTVKDVSDAHPKLTFSRPSGSVFASARRRSPSRSPTPPATATARRST
jgi:hypothetical protein